MRTRRDSSIRHLVIITGCAAAFGAGAPTLAQSAKPADRGYSADADPKMNDVNISDAIERELLLSPTVMSYKIDVKTDKGVVTLSGEVNNLLAKRRAAKLAATVTGVTQVKNQVKVAPPMDRSDSAVKKDVLAALASDPATDDLSLEVTVDDGAVTLAGDVESAADMRVAEHIAAGVRGVTEMTNNLEIEYLASRSDSEIETDIRSTLHWDTLVDDDMIEIEVDEGVVTLTGVVGSLAEKYVATIDAWVNGVIGVDAAGLTVARWARDNALRATKYGPRDDDDIKTAIESKLLYNARVASFNVRTSVDDGVVTLRGGVDNLMAKRQAAREARSVVGVSKVKNNLTVAPADDRSDSAIADDVRAALLRSPDVSRYEVRTTVESDVVTLRGAVDSWWEKARADDLAASVNGVVAVNNNLVVEDAYDPLIFDPYVVDYDAVLFDWYDYTPPMAQMSDADIRDEINDELFWSPFVDANQITITVDNGVATLSGAVDSWSERWAATENAYEGGAIWVHNDLTIKTDS